MTDQSSAGGHCEQFWHGQGCPLFDVIHPAFLLPTTASVIIQGALKDGFGEAVVACDIPKACLNSCQKRFLWTNNGVDSPPRPVVGLVLQVEDAEKFPQTLGIDTLDPFFRIGKQGPCSTAIEEDGGDQRLIDIELACEAAAVLKMDFFAKELGQLLHCKYIFRPCKQRFV